MRFPSRARGFALGVVDALSQSSCAAISLAVPPHNQPLFGSLVSSNIIQARFNSARDGIAMASQRVSVLRFYLYLYLSTVMQKMN